MQYIYSTLMKDTLIQHKRIKREKSFKKYNTIVPSSVYISTLYNIYVSSIYFPDNPVIQLFIYADVISHNSRLY